MFLLLSQSFMNLSFGGYQARKQSLLEALDF